MIAIHANAVGPVAGGCRLWQYDADRQSVTNVLRSAQGIGVHDIFRVEANNQLKDQPPRQRLRRRRSRHAPDYLVNAAGIISVVIEYLGVNHFRRQMARGGRRAAAGNPVPCGYALGDI